MSAFSQFSPTPAPASSYLSTIGAFYDGRKNELADLKAFAENFETPWGEKLDLPDTPSKANKYLHRFMSRYFHMSDVVIEEMADLLEKTSERASNSFIMLKAVLALALWGMDLWDIYKEKFQVSLLAKAFFSSCLVVTSTLIVVAAMGAYQVFAAAQMLFSAFITGRALVELYRARKEKVENKQALNENTKELAKLAAQLNVLTAVVTSLTKLKAEREAQAKVGNFLRVTYINSDIKKLEEEKQALEAGGLDAVKKEFTQKIRERLELEDQRDKIKKEYHHAMVDVGIGFNNVIAAGVSLFLNIWAGLAIAGGSIVATLADFKYMAKQRATEKLAKAEPAYHKDRVETSIEATPKVSVWRRFVSLGSRREVSEEQAQHIKGALGLMENFHQSGHVNVETSLIAAKKGTSALERKIELYQKALSDKGVSTKDQGPTL